MQLFVSETEAAGNRPDRRAVDRFVNLAHRYRYASDCRVQRDEQGKPSLLSSAGEPLSRFCSISHTRDWLACVFAERSPVGVDIEIARPRNYVETGSWFFGADVGARLASAQPDAQSRLFYHAWTAYEALYKCGVNRRRGMLPLLQPPPDAAAEFTLRWLLGPQGLHACVALLRDGPACNATISVLHAQGDSFAADERWRSAAPWV